ncbi:hypothetical protein ACOJBM_35455 [Rhizobium beringeri]
MGFAGLTNFGAAAFMGAGGYTVAMLGRFGEVPGLISLICAGAVSVVIGFVFAGPGSSNPRTLRCADDTGVQCYVHGLCRRK